MKKPTIKFQRNVLREAIGKMSVDDFKSASEFTQAQALANTLDTNDALAESMKPKRKRRSKEEIQNAQA